MNRTKNISSLLFEQGSILISDDDICMRVSVCVQFFEKQSRKFTCDWCWFLGTISAVINNTTLFFCWLKYFFLLCIGYSLLCALI